MVTPIRPPGIRNAFDHRCSDGQRRVVVASAGRSAGTGRTTGNADAIVVLDGGFPLRNQHAIDLYREGWAREIWRTGDLPGGSVVLQKARRLALQQGVPETAFVPVATDSTWADGREIARMAQERHAQRLLIVTEWPHSRRAMCVINRHLAGTGVVAFYDGPRHPPYTPVNWWRDPEGRRIVSGEMLKTIYYLLRFGVTPWAC